MPGVMNMDIKSAIRFILSIENLQSKQELDAWCGDQGREKLYAYIILIAPEHWGKIRTPTNSVRYYYQKMLPGYKIYN
jgi:hypothetical protein